MDASEYKHLINLNFTSLKITFKSKYMNSIEREIYKRFDELKSINDSLNRIKAKEKL